MKKVFFLLSFSFLFLLLLLWSFEFNDEITSEDRIYADSLLLGCGLDLRNPAPADFSKQIQQISEVQKCVIQYLKAGEGIPMNHSRNVRDLFRGKNGLCYDLSYTMEKIFRMKGYQIRHAALYHKKGKNSISTFFSSSVSSHAICEVKTAKGWMIVDSVFPFLGLRNNEPVDIETLNQMVVNGTLNTSEFNNFSDFYMEDNLYIYGLYSRHGRFFSPYNFIPDYQFQQLLYNFI